MATYKKMQEKAKEHGFELERDLDRDEQYVLFHEGEEAGAFSLLTDVDEFLENSSVSEENDSEEKEPEEDPDEENKQDEPSTDKQSGAPEDEDGDNRLGLFSESEEDDTSKMEDQ